MFNVWVNAVPVLLHRKTAVTNCFFLSLSLQPASLPLWDMHSQVTSAQSCMLPTPVSKLALILQSPLQHLAC